MRLARVGTMLDFSSSFLYRPSICSSSNGTFSSVPFAGYRKRAMDEKRACCVKETA